VTAYEGIFYSGEEFAIGTGEERCAIQSPRKRKEGLGCGGF